MHRRSIAAALSALAGSGRGAAGAACRWCRRRRAGRPGAGDRSWRCAASPVVLIDDAKAASARARAASAGPSAPWRSSIGSASAERMVAKGVTWKLGKVFHGDDLFYRSTCSRKAGHKMPAFINLQQYYVEQSLIERARELPASTCAGSTAASASRPTPDRARARRSRRRTAPIRSTRDWLIACDGARSPVRDLHGPAVLRPRVRGPVPDRRYRDAGRLPDRALVLVRPAVPPPASPRCCTSSPTISGASTCSWARTPTRSRSTSPSGSSPRLEAMLGKDRAVRARMDQRLHFPLPAARALRAWPRDLCRRRRASGLAVRRARRQWRRTGCGQSGLEARGRAGRPGAHRR